MPPCHNLLEIAKTRRRLAFMRACDLVVNPDRSDPDWCLIVDKALDEYDNAARQIKELTNKENSEVEL
jgi:hypothetical protein